MRIFKYILIATSCIGILFSCQEDKMPYLKLKNANVYFDLNTSRFDPTIVENAPKLKVPLILAGVPGTHPVNVSVETDTTGIENPAIEGVDYTIKQKTVTFKEGYGTQYIEIHPINNEERQPNRSFRLSVASSSKDLCPNPANSITITILDAGHPLLYMKGAYQVTARDIIWTGQLAHFNVQINPDPEDDDAVYVENVPLGIIPQNIRFKMYVDAAHGICTVPPQQVGSFDHEGISGGIGLYYTFTYIDPSDGLEYVDYDENRDITFSYLNEGKTLKANSLIGTFIILSQYYGQFFVFEDFIMERIESSAAQAQSLPLLPGEFPYTSPGVVKRK